MFSQSNGGIRLVWDQGNFYKYSAPSARSVTHSAKLSAVTNNPFKSQETEI